MALINIPMQQKRVFISTSTFGKCTPEPLLTLRRAGFDVDLNPLGRQLTEAEIREFLRAKQVIGLIAGTEPLSQDVIYSARNLKVVSRCGIGIDNIDIEALKERRIKLYRTPEGPSLAVAELTLGLMLDALRYISYMNMKIGSGGWEKKMGRLLTGKIVGIVGMGTIGKRLTTLLRPFKCMILAKDLYPDDHFAKENMINYVDLDELLRQSDIVTLHLPFDNETEGLFDTKLFSKMKEEAIFINTSRGKVVDEDALYAALRDSKISHACLDVYRNEPYAGKLKGLNNVTLTCHVGAYAKEARIAMEREAVENILEGFRETGVM